MSQNSYPQPPPFTWNKHHIRDVLPIYPPTRETLDSIQPPVLPSPPRKPAFDAPFTLTTHLFPATYLRTSKSLPLPKPPPAGATKEERHRVFAETTLQLLDWGNDTTMVMDDGYPLVLWNCVNRYVKNDLNEFNKTGVTLFFAHANGFPKEVSLVKKNYFFTLLKENSNIDFSVCAFLRRFGNRQWVFCFLRLLLEL
jgi:hypothetical protein